MKVFIFLTVLFLSFAQVLCESSSAAIPSFLWAKQIGVSGKYKWDQAYALTTDSLGNIILSGSISGAVIFGNTTIDEGPFIAKYDGNGNVLWAKRTSTTGYTYVYSIATDIHDNIITAGFFTGSITVAGQTFISRGSADIFVCKYDYNGNLIWARQSGGTKGDYGRSVAIDNLGNIIVVGDFIGTAIFGDSETITSRLDDESDVFVAKYNASGNLIWVTGTSHIWGSCPTCVTIDGSGDIIVTGKIDTDFGGFVRKYDSYGAVIWSKDIESSYPDVCTLTAYSVVVYNANYGSGRPTFGYVVAGSFSGTITFNQSGYGDITLNSDQGGGFRVIYNPNNGSVMNTDWKVVDQYQLSYSTDNGTWLAGDNSHTHMCRLEDYIPSGYWGFSIYDDLGGGFWHKYVTRSNYSTYDARETNISFDAAGNIIVAGYFKGNLFFDSIALINSAQDFDYDIFVAKLGDKRKLTTRVIGGIGNILPGASIYENGTVVNLIAQPSAEYKVKRWSGTNDDSLVGLTNAVTMNNDKLVGVEFELSIGNPDLDGNGQVDFGDFAIFANEWNIATCGTPDWCDGADLDKDNHVGLSDLMIFASHWLEMGTE
jgi:hypothetical protein